MKLSTDQCIEVAERIWKWDTSLDPAEGFIFRVNSNDQITEWSVEDFHKEVLSWTGFGRTLESMAERNFYLEMHPNFVAKFFKIRQTYSVTCHTPRIFASPQEIIEATHLAALEALEKDK